MRKLTYSPRCSSAVRVELHPDAKLDLLEAADWYDRRAEGLGDDLVAEFDLALISIREMPRTWPVWPGAPTLEPPLQRFLLSRFAHYAVAFRAFSDRIAVLAVVHSSRKPFFWLDRTNSG